MFTPDLEVNSIRKMKQETASPSDCCNSLSCQWLLSSWKEPPTVAPSTHFHAVFKERWAPGFHFCHSKKINNYGCSPVNHHVSLHHSPHVWDCLPSWNLLLPSPSGIRSLQFFPPTALTPSSFSGSSSPINPLSFPRFYIFSLYTFIPLVIFSNFFLLLLPMIT